MNRLIYELESIYAQSRIEAKIDEETNSLNVKQRILTPGGFLNLDIYVIADMQNMQRYLFVCRGLGKNNRPSDEDRRKIEIFNENNNDMTLSLEEENEYALSFERDFYGIDAYGINTVTLKDAMNCVAEFHGFIKRTYPDLKRIIRSLA